MYLDTNGNFICGSFSSQEAKNDGSDNTFRAIAAEVSAKIKNMPRNMCVIEYPQKQRYCKRDNEYDKPSSGGKAMLNAPYHTEMIFHIQNKEEKTEDTPHITGALIHSGRISIIASGSGGRSLFLESLNKK